MKVEIKSTFVLSQDSSFDSLARQKLRDTVSMLMLETDLTVSIIDRRVLGAVARDGAFTSEQWKRFVQVINRAIQERKERHAVPLDGVKSRFSAAVLEQLSGIECLWLELCQQINDEMFRAAPVRFTGMHEPTTSELLRDATQQGATA